jgi:hypothetical protein
MNPGDQGSDKTILPYINDQNTTKQTRSKLDAYAMYYESFRDCTSEFIDKFKTLFITVVAPNRALWYITENEGE